MTTSGLCSPDEILDALARYAVNVGRTISLSTFNRTVRTYGVHNPDGCRDPYLVDLFRHATTCGVLAAEAHADGTAALYTLRFGLLSRRSASPLPLLRGCPYYFNGADLYIPNGAALVCLPDDMSAHARLAEVDLLTRIRPDTRIHAVHLWDLRMCVGVVLPEDNRLICLLLARFDRESSANLFFLPRPRTILVSAVTALSGTL